MIPVTIAVLLFGAAVFGIGLLAAKGLDGARARVPQPARNRCAGIGRFPDSWVKTGILLQIPLIAPTVL